MEEPQEDWRLYLGPWRRGMYIMTNDVIKPMDWRYTVEKCMYGASVLLGVLAFAFTVFRLCRTDRKKLILAARLYSYKLSLTTADFIILFLYAPIQLIWITTFWWNAGDMACRLFKFVSAFGFYLTANMQVVVAFDRLYITATMRTCRLSRKKEPYNTRMCLIAAWSLALLCSMPQLFVFGTSSPGEGKEQCVTIWLQRRMDHMEQLEYIRDYAYHVSLRTNKSSELFYPNGTIKYWLEKPTFTEESILEESRQWMHIEQAYNIVHLTTLCVLPYVLELFCYTMILYLLKGAQQGQFLSISEVFTSRCCCIGTGKSSTLEEPLNVHRSSSVTSTDFTSWLKKIRPRTLSVSEPHSAKKAITVALLSPRDSRDRSASCSQLSAHQAEKSDEASLPPKYPEPDQYGSNKRPSTGGSASPWVVTVNSARRKARMKAFWMLSVNLLLWSPYCLAAIINAITIFPQFLNFQFACALVAFNSVSNLLL